MADKKISTIVLEVDLECERCDKKIRRVLYKIQEKMNIKTTSLDDRRNIVTISGPFDAEKVRRKLCCEAGRIIKGMDVIEDEEEEEEYEEKEEKKTAAVPVLHEVNLRPLLEKMLEPKTKSQPQRS